MAGLSASEVTQAWFETGQNIHLSVPTRIQVENTT